MFKPSVMHTQSGYYFLLLIHLVPKANFSRKLRSIDCLMTDAFYLQTLWASSCTAGKLKERCARATPTHFIYSITNHSVRWTNVDDHHEYFLKDELVNWVYRVNWIFFNDGMWRMDEWIIHLFIEENDVCLCQELIKISFSFSFRSIYNIQEWK